MTKKTINLKRIVTAAIAVGMLLYLSKLLRPYFVGQDPALFILGFLPNLGLSFALPFIYVANRIRLNQPVRHFSIACIVTFCLMVLNEIRDQYQTGRVFDWYDILGSLAGLALTFLVFRLTFEIRKESI